MAVSFTNETWLYVEQQIEAAIKKHASICTNSQSSYKVLLQAQGAIAALKTIKDLPQAAKRAANIRE